MRPLIQKNFFEVCLFAQDSIQLGSLSLHSARFAPQFVDAIQCGPYRLNNFILNIFICKEIVEGNRNRLICNRNGEMSLCVLRAHIATHGAFVLNAKLSYNAIAVKSVSTFKTKHIGGDVFVSTGNGLVQNGIACTQGFDANGTLMHLSLNCRCKFQYQNTYSQWAIDPEWHRSLRPEPRGPSDYCERGDEFQHYEHFQHFSHIENRSTGHDRTFEDARPDESKC